MSFKNSKVIMGILIAAVVVLICAGSSFATSVNQGACVSVPVSDYSKIVSDITSSGSDSSVNYNGVSLTRAQVLYILTKAVSVIGTTGSDQGTINVGYYNNAPHPSGADLPQSISKAQYVDMANRFSTWIEVHNQVPNFVGINQAGVPDVSPTMMESICIKVLSEYQTSGQLPGSVSTLY